MLFDRGPIDPIDVEGAIAPSPLPPLEGAVAALASTFDGHDAAIAAAQATMGSDAGAGDVDAGGFDLDAADVELAGQAGALDPSIGGVAAAAETQDGDIPGLSSESQQDAESSTAIDWPDYVSHEPDKTHDPRPPHPDPQDPHPDPEPSPTGDPFADAVIALYLQALNRTPSADEIEIHRGNPGGIEGVRQTILASAEYRHLHGG